MLPPKIKVTTDDVIGMFQADARPRFLSLPVDLALWLIYRRSKNRPVPGSWVVQNFPGVTLSHIENFFSSKYGIGGIPAEKRNLKTVCQRFGVSLITEEDAAKMISDLENKHGDAASSASRTTRTAKRKNTSL